MNCTLICTPVDKFSSFFFSFVHLFVALYIWWACSLCSLRSFIKNTFSESCLLSNKKNTTAATHSIYRCKKKQRVVPMFLFFSFFLALYTATLNDAQNIKSELVHIFSRFPSVKNCARSICFEFSLNAFWAPIQPNGKTAFRWYSDFAGLLSFSL